jgi:hypothetical protein
MALAYRVFASARVRFLAGTCQPWDLSVKSLHNTLKRGPFGLMLCLYFYSLLETIRGNSAHCGRHIQYFRCELVENIKSKEVLLFSFLF